MFRKLRIQLTIFFTLGTGFILAAMSGGCLYISQKSIDQNSYNKFLPGSTIHDSPSMAARTGTQ